jgi:ribosomal protein S18 acetylase RimI-like enzyme
LVDEQVLGHIYAAPYVHFEPDLCWLLVREAVPVGYILGTSDSSAFADWASTNWWDSLRQHYASAGENNTWTQQMIGLMQQGYQPPPGIDGYSAHLHIDLLPIGQKRGWGKVLIDVFCNRLKEMGIDGVHLDVSRRNLNAIGFYTRVGFRIIESGTSSIRFARKLSD